MSEFLHERPYNATTLSLLKHVSTCHILNFKHSCIFFYRIQEVTESLGFLLNPILPWLYIQAQASQVQKSPDCFLYLFSLYCLLFCFVLFCVFCFVYVIRGSMCILHHFVRCNFAVYQIFSILQKCTCTVWIFDIKDIATQLSQCFSNYLLVTYTYILNFKCNCIFKAFKKVTKSLLILAKPYPTLV